MMNERKKTESPVRFRTEAPEFLAPFCHTAPMQRLRNVGMNCGCEYTSFPLFRKLQSYSRYRHSLCAARIVWDFSGDTSQTLAALFHDIATPTFAHSVDFLRGDHLRQESTEADTERMIRDCVEIVRLLDQYGIELDRVVDYHRYPIADNDAPRLSADRLEYTLGNLDNYGFRCVAELQAYYDDLTVSVNETGETELCFRDADTAISFGLDALRCSRVYVSEQDRYAMQMLAELLSRAIEREVLSAADLSTTEPQVIEKMRQDPETAVEWERFCALHEMLYEEKDAPLSNRRVIPAKKRYVDPFVAGKGRASSLDARFADELLRFLSEPQDRWICGR